MRRFSSLLLVERGSCACGDRHAGVDEAEFTGGGGEEVEEAEHDANSRSKSLASGEC